MTSRRASVAVAVVGLVVAIGILTLLVALPASALRVAPCLDLGQLPITFHTGTEPKIPVYYGKGADRQILVFCVHVAPGIGYAETPVHVLGVFDDPEPPAETPE